MSWIRIDALDVWLFRDGKPFTAGDDNGARSMFPPTPLTVQGALRQHISVSLGAHFWQYKKGHKKATEAIAAIGPYGAMLEIGTFEMRGPFVYVEDEDGNITPMFRAPADLFLTTLKETATEPDCEVNDEQRRPCFEIIMPAENTTYSDLDKLHFATLNKCRQGNNLQDYWLTADTLAAYLEGNKPDVDTYLPQAELRGCADETRLPEPDCSVAHQLSEGKTILPSSLLYSSDNRFGVSTSSRSGTAEEGLLYQAEFVRPAQGVGLLVDVRESLSNPKILDTATITLGGESRQARIQPVDQPRFFATAPHTPEDTKRFKIVFLTPAYFKDGWQPEGGDWSRWLGTDAKLVGAAVYSPQKIGGWISATRSPRPMHNFVPAGSVYYFEGAVQKPPNAISEDPDHFSSGTATKIGFGQVAYGRWKSKEKST